jgi:hypothetical protein
VIIDFTEIPSGNRGGTHQDLFEQFACDFFETIGYKIIQRPHRGADRGKDLIILDSVETKEGPINIKWLVSCKHFAHSNKSVTPSDEINILERVRVHQCDGFLGFYSTLTSTGLSDFGTNLSSETKCSFYDYARIEKEILSSSQKSRILNTYFPKSSEKYHSIISFQNEPLEKSNTKVLSENDVLRIAQTAIILIEIIKIEERFSNSDDWEEKAHIINELYKFCEYSDKRISERVFRFLTGIASGTRYLLPSDFSIVIYSVIVSFYTPFGGSSIEDETNNGIQCTNIGFNLAYDAFIYLNDFKVALYGLLIMKYIYFVGKRIKDKETCDHVLQQFDDLKHTLSRPERNDLEDAKILTNIFRLDLDAKDMLIPEIPNYIYQKAKL